MSNEENVSTPTAARGMLQIAAKEIVSAISGVVFFVFISRLLADINELGILVGLQTMIGMFVLISSLGMPYVATRFISTYIGSNQRSKANKLYPLIFILSVVLSAIFSTALFFFSYQLSEMMFHDENYALLVQLAALDIFFLGIFTSCISLLDASMEFSKIARISIVTSLLRYSLSFGFFIYGWGLNGIILGLALADGFGAIGFAFALLPRFFGTTINVSSFSVELRPILKFALSIYGWAIINYLLTRADVYLLMILTTLYLVGIYAPAVFIGATFYILLASLDQALVPLTSRIYGKHGIANFKSSAVQASRFLLLFYFPLGFAIAASSPTLVTLVMGPRFAESAYPMAIIVAAITLTSPGIVANNLLRSAGYTGIALKAGVLALLVQILLSMIMIPPFGLIGASAARFFAYFVLMIPLIIKLNLIGGFDFDRVALKFGLLASGIVSLEIIVISIMLNEPYSLLLQYTIALLSYFLFLRSTHVLNQRDVQMIDRTFMGKIKWLTVPLAKIMIRDS